MNEKLTDLAKQALAGPMTKEERRVLGNALFRYGWRVALFAFVIWSFGGFARWGLGGGFAIASQVDGQVDAKVAAAVAPIKSDVESLKKEQQQQRTILEKTQELAVENQANDYEGKILDFMTRQCEAKKAGQLNVVSTWRALVSDYQARYLKLTGRSFPAPSCSEL